MAYANQSSRPDSQPRVGLFVTCLADLFRPNVGFAAVKLLEDGGCRVEVPQLQTCCGQPAYNNGDLAHSRKIAKQVISAFEDYDYVVAPSGSCTGMMKVHYPQLFPDEKEWQDRAEQLSGRSHELLSFLTDVLNMTKVDARYMGTVTYHDSCSNLRELTVRNQPRRLLAGVQGLELVEMHDTNVCCGFGGTFCVKYPEISGRMVSDKANNVLESGADTLLAGDLGCLLNIAGCLKRADNNIKVYHCAEVLANMTDVPGIGDSAKQLDED